MLSKLILVKACIKAEMKQKDALIVPAECSTMVTYSSPLYCSTRDIITNSTAAATRIGLSSTQHLFKTASIINNSGGNIDDFVLSPASTKRKRKAEQEAIADKIKDDFKDKWAGYPKIVQWDRKMMELLEGNGRVYQDVNAVVLNAPGSDAPPHLW